MRNNLRSYDLMSWTGENLDTLITRHKAGDNASVIAKGLRTSRSAVLGKIRRLRQAGVLEKGKSSAAG